jgi:hypothetical protein
MAPVALSVAGNQIKNSGLAGNSLICFHVLMSCIAHSVILLSVIVQCVNECISGSGTRACHAPMLCLQMDWWLGAGLL